MSLESSGVDAYFRDETVHCLACDWEGLIEVFIDRETNVYYFECPACTTPTSEDYL
jgi:hypothetical protein